MRTAMTIASRELGSYFRQPAGWIIVSLYLLLAGLVFATSVLVPGRPASLREFFAISGWLLLPVAPAISMRLIAEELRSGTIENLLTAPVSAWALVIGKYIGACAFLAAMLTPTLVYPVLLFMHASPTPDIGPVIAGYSCLLLLGALYLALGLLASTLTNNATLAFMITLFGILAFIFAGVAGDAAPAALKPAIYQIAVGPRVLDFARGVLDTSHIIFFAAVSAYFVLLSVAVMEVRRWR